MTVDYPILLPSFPELLRQENDLHPLVYLQLAAWLVSWVDMKVQQFHSQLKDCFWLYGEPGQRKIFFSLDKVDLLLVWTTSQSPFSVFRFYFLSSQFEAGLEYRALNVYHSGLSATHPHIEGYNVGEHPLVVQLLRGIFNSRPPTPRYTYTWDVSTVKSYLESLGPNEQLSLKHLSRKLAFLLAITSAERGSELVDHDLRFKGYHPECVSVNLPELTKGVWVGKPLKTSFHSSFPENKLLCQCSCLIRTRAFRLESISEPNKLFLSFNNSHEPVSPATLSHWVKNCLLEVGISVQGSPVHAWCSYLCSTKSRHLYFRIIPSS